MTVAVSISLLIAGLSAWGAWRADQRLCKSETRNRWISSVILIAISAWIIPLILLANWLQIPGYYGPVQYWNDGPGGGMALFHVRAFSMLAMMVGLLVAVAAFAGLIAGFFAETRNLQWRRSLIPTISLVAYFLAWTMLMAYRFFPTV
jgi:hypothetical protein